MVDSEFRVYLGNLDYQTSVGDLAEFAGQFVKVSGVRLPFDNIAGRIRGFAFLSVESAEDLATLIKSLDGMTYHGRKLKVAEAVPKGY